MYSTPLLPFAIIVSAVVLLFVGKTVFSSLRTLPLPPGPKGLPLVGNVFDVPHTVAWKAFQAWGAKWGILYLPSINHSSTDVARRRNHLLSYFWETGHCSKLGIHCPWLAWRKKRYLLLQTSVYYGQWGVSLSSCNIHLRILMVKPRAVSDGFVPWYRICCIFI